MRSDQVANRHVLAGLAMSVLCACGGGGDDDGGSIVTPPPPPPPVQATSLVVVAGSGQEATAGQAVTTAPTVRALSASNTGVSGVVITFTVESGGGSVQHAQVTTDQSGLASAGQWTLGPVAGSNSVRASATGLSPVTIQATGLVAELVGASATIGPGGGSIEIVQPGKPGDGMRITIPSGGFGSDVPVTIDVDTGRGLPLPAGVSVAGPVYRITGFPERTAGAFLSVRLPLTVPSDSVVAAFLHDPSTGRLELLPAQSRTASEYTVVTRHLSPALMLQTSGLSQRRMMASALTAGGLEIVTVKAAEALIADGAESGFRPGTDDWEFKNKGSYISQGGHCAGQSLAAIWYYLRRKPMDGPLFERLSTIADFDPENRNGYRFASVVQELLNWHALERDFMLATGTSLGTGIPLDKLHFTASVLSMLITGEPQLIPVQNDRIGHVMVAFRADANRLYVADPNFPGETRVIEFDGTNYVPFPTKPTADGETELFDVIRGAGVTSLVPLGTLDALWLQVMAGTIGDGMFPELRYEYFDLLNDSWTALPDNLVTRQDEIRVRSICAECTEGMPPAPATTPPPWVEWLTAYDVAGESIGDGWLPSGQTSEGTTIPLQLGAQKIGLFTQAPEEGDRWAFLDWKWLEVIAVPFSIEPGESKVAVDVPVSFVARPNGAKPPVSRYVWDFDDGGPPVTVPEDSTVEHTFTEPGLRTVSVELWDHAASKRLARATATVEVGDSVTTWIFDELTGTAPAWNPVDVSTVNDWVRQGLFFDAIKTAPATGRLDYVEPPDHPERGTIRLFVTPSPTTINSLLLATRDTTCDHAGVLEWEGSTTNGTVIGKGRINSCLIGPTPGSRALASKFEIEATAVGRNLTGVIRAIYQDFNRVGTNHIPTTSMTVTYTFTARRP